MGALIGTSHWRYLLSFPVDIMCMRVVCANQGAHLGSSAMLKPLYGPVPLRSCDVCCCSCAVQRL